MKFMRHSGLIWVVWSVVILLADRYTKLYMLNNLSFGNPQPVLPVLSYTLAFNTGAAFSFLHNASGWQNIFFLVFSRSGEPCDTQMVVGASRT